MDSWAFELAAISALFAAVAAAASLMQAFKASQSNEVNVYLGMMAEYGSAEMRKAISELASFWRSQKSATNDVSRAFVQLAERSPEEAATLRGHSRRLSAYFVNAARLREAKLISRPMLKLIISHPGLNVFYDVAVRINATKNAHHNSVKYAEILKRVVERHGNGLY